MRVVGGAFRGRPLAAPRSQAIRPTSDRARETLFNMIAHNWPDALSGTRVLDLFAGTGALGIEAVSRGASHCLFVEQSVEGRGLLRDNIEALGLYGRTRILRRDAAKLGIVGTIAPFDLVLADPPYGRQLGEAAISSAISGGWLSPGALVMVEEAAVTAFRPPERLETLAAREIGETVVTFCRYA